MLNQVLGVFACQQFVVYAVKINNIFGFSNFPTIAAEVEIFVMHTWRISLATKLVKDFENRFTFAKVIIHHRPFMRHSVYLCSVAVGSFYFIFNTAM